MKKSFQLAVSLGLTLVVGYLIYRGVPDWRQAWNVMIQGRPVFFLGGLCFVLLHMFLRSVRWGVLLAPVKANISLKSLFSLTLIKYVVNVIPPRVGEVVASVVLARKENMPATSVIAASILERVLDMLTVVIIFGVYLSFFSHRFLPTSEHGKHVMAMIQNYSIKGIIGLVVAFFLVRILLRNDRWMSRLPHRVRGLMQSFLDGFRGLQRGGVLSQAVVLSLLIWLAITLQLWCMMLAYIDNFPFLGALFLMALTVVGVAIPTPGGVGGFQFFMSLALVNFFASYLSSSDPQSQAAGISNGSYLVSMVPVMLIGLFFLNREGLSFKKVSQMAEQDRDKQ